MTELSPRRERFCQEYTNADDSFPRPASFDTCGREVLATLCQSKVPSQNLSLDRQAHNLKVAGSNPAPATITSARKINDLARLTAGLFYACHAINPYG